MPVDPVSRVSSVPGVGTGDAPWARPVEGGVVLDLHCQPGARVTEVVGVHGDRLKLKLAAPPVDGKANEALVGWLATRLGVPRGDVSLVAGETNRQKRVKVLGIDVRAALGLDPHRPA